MLYIVSPGYTSQEGSQGSLRTSCMVTDGVGSTLCHIHMCQHMHGVARLHRRSHPPITQLHLQPPVD